MDKILNSEDKENIRSLVKRFAEETGSHIHTEWIGDADVLEIVPSQNNDQLYLRLIYTYDVKIPSIDMVVRSNLIRQTSIQTRDYGVAYALLITIFSKHLESINDFEKVINIG